MKDGQYRQPHQRAPISRTAGIFGKCMIAHHVT
jgi:hypothetical protein